MTPLQQHIADWKDCHRCNLCQTRKHVVIGRGKVPCDILFVGEAPGRAEDANGDPFKGQAGRKMDDIIRRGVPDKFTYALTNLIGCIPLDEDRDKTEEPNYDSIEACAPRLQQFTDLCRPRLIVCVGKLASAWLNPANLKNSWKILGPGKTHTSHPGSKIPRADITHPSFIARANPAQQSILLQRAVVSLRGSIIEYLS